MIKGVGLSVQRVMLTGMDYLIIGSPYADFNGNKSAALREYLCHPLMIFIVGD